MPIVSEHPRSIEVIKKLSDQCDSELETFISEYTERRRAYEASVEARRSRKRVREAPAEEAECRELLSLLEAREAQAEELRDELQLMTKELALLKRELRRVRRQLIDMGIEEEIVDEPALSAAPGVPSMPSIGEYVGRVRQSNTLGWLKPWLRGFLPTSA